MRDRGRKEDVREGRTQVEGVGDVGAIERKSGGHGEKEEGAGRV